MKKIYLWASVLVLTFVTLLTLLKSELLKNFIYVGDRSVLGQGISKPCPDATGHSLLDCGTGTGNFDYTIDLDPVPLQLVYNSLSTATGTTQAPFGDRFSLSIDWQFSPTLGLMLGDGTRIPVVASGSDYVVADDRFPAMIFKRSGSTYTATDSNGTTYRFLFNSALNRHVLDRSSSRKGDWLLLTRNSSGWITRIQKSQLPASINITYNQSSPTQMQSIAIAYSHQPSTPIYTFKFNQTKLATIQPGDAPDANTYSWKLEYNESGLLKRAKNNFGKVMAVSYVTGTPYVAAVVEDGFVTTTTYQANKVTTEENGNSLIEEFSNGKITATTQNGTRTTYTRDANGRISQETDHFGRQSNYTYEGASQTVKSIVRGSERWDYTYVITSGFRRLASEKYASSSGSILTSYSWSGFDLDKISVNGKTTDYDYDAYGNVTRVQNSLGEVEFSNALYGEFGTLKEYQDKFGNVHKFSYDGYGRMISSTSPTGQVASVSRDYLNQVQSQSNGHVTSNYTYDIMGRLTYARTQSSTDGSVETSGAWTRRADGSFAQFSTQQKRNGVLENTYISTFDDSQENELKRVQWVGPNGTIDIMNAEKGYTTPLNHSNPFPAVPQ